MPGALPRSFGVEEEYLLLDAGSGRPVDRAADLIREMPEVRDRAEREYFSSQLETATPICRAADEAEGALMRFRNAAADAAKRNGIVLAGSGLPPIGGDTAGTVTPRARYLAIAARMRGAAENQYVTGTHVHVEVPSRKVGVEVIDRIARWAPALLAMTANSPIWCGDATGFASWRHVMGLYWPLHGFPLGFAGDADYDRAIEQLVASRIIIDPGLVTWAIRLSADYPTVELRIADAQLDPSAAVSYALIVRALVDRAVNDTEAGVERPRYSHGVVDGAVWLAARNGLASELVDPLTGESLPAFELVGRMLSTVEAELDRFGDLGRIERFLQGLRDHGGPATRQLETFASGGIEGLLELYRGFRY